MWRNLIVVLISAGTVLVHTINAEAQPAMVPAPSGSANESVADQAATTPSGTNRAPGGGFAYARLGYGGVIGDRFYGTRAIGFGYRGELDAFAIDGSFFNIQVGPQGIDARESAASISFLKLQVLYFLTRDATASGYVGGGLSWGSSGFSRRSAGPYGSANWFGTGYQGELTAGYEMLRDSPIRVFFEGNVVLPFYRLASERYSARQPGGAVEVSHRYAPSAVASIGFGWRRD